MEKSAYTFATKVRVAQSLCHQNRMFDCLSIDSKMCKSIIENMFLQKLTILSPEISKMTKIVYLSI